MRHYFISLLSASRFFVVWVALLFLVAPAKAQHEAVNLFNEGKKLNTSTPEWSDNQAREVKSKPKLLVNEPLEKSLLWEISGNGLSTPSYLFGTIHMICAEDFVWDERMERAFVRAEKLVMEVDMDEIEERFGNMFGTLSTAKVKELPETLDYFVDEKFELLVEEIVDLLADIPSWREWKYSLEEMFTGESTMEYRDALIEAVRLGILRKQEGLPLLIKTPPPFRSESDADGASASEMITLSPPSAEGDMIPPTGEYPNASMLLDCDRVVSYEGKLTIKAREKKMEIDGLETIDEQLAALYSDEVPYESSFQFDQALEDLQNPLEFLIKVYLNQDINLMLELMVLPEMGVSNLETFLFVRNENWVEKLPEMMKKNSLFIAVGAGHLPGSRGIIQLLRDKGYTLTPILK